MQCKLGDLAIVVNDFEHPINNGCLLMIVAKAPLGAFAIPADWIGRPLSTFEFNGRKQSPGGQGIVVYRDVELRPLRDSDGQDETLVWAGLPARPELETA